MGNCIFCDEPTETFLQPDPQIVQYTCPRCGQYSITGSAVYILQDKTLFTPRQKANISGWLRENQGYRIDSYAFDTLKNIKTPSFAERADKILLALEKITEHAGESKKIEKSWISWGWCHNKQELDEFLDFLQNSMQRIVLTPHNAFKGRATACQITPTGWQHLEKLKTVNADSQQGFVAMSFTKEMQRIYESTISEGILDAGYKPHKVDLREHNEKIDDEIIAQIRRSRFVLADFTDQRGGVYFEAGFGKGLGLEVFWACRKDEIDANKLHFDVRQFNCIDWQPDDLPNFRKRIANRIESVIGRGTYKRDSA